MNNRDYWIKREKTNQERIIKEQAGYEKEINRIYDLVQMNVQRDINNLYARYYNTHDGMTLIDVKQKVSETDVKAFEAKAAEYVRTKDFSAEANERLEIYNLTMRINRLEMLKSEIGLELIDGSNQLDKAIKTQLLNEAHDEAKRQAGILGDHVYFSQKTIESIVNGSYKSESVTFSENIWGYTDELKGTLDGLLSRVIIQGEHPTAVAKQLDKVFGSTKYQSERLMRTESCRVYSTMAEESIKQSGYDKIEWLAEPDACDECAALDGQVFDVNDGDRPPVHPNCRCAILPYLD